MERVLNQLNRVYQLTGERALATQDTRRESVSEFVAFFYEFVRDDADVVRVLDRALKERYGSKRD